MKRTRRSAKSDPKATVSFEGMTKRAPELGGSGPPHLQRGRGESSPGRASPVADLRRRGT